MTESPKFRNKIRESISKFRAAATEELIFTGNGAPRTKGTVDNIPTCIILNSGAFGIIISTSFIYTSQSVLCMSSHTMFFMADGSFKKSLGVSRNISGQIGGIKTADDAPIFNHNQYNFPLGSKLSFVITFGPLSTTQRRLT